MSVSRSRSEELSERNRSHLPTSLIGFEHISRHWDERNNTCTAKILPGEYYVTTKDEMITTVLGSCISACIRDPVVGVGGMNHFMLPEHIDGASDAWEVTAINSGTRYGSFAMENLINDILKHGGKKHRLETKVFGGGRVLQLNFDVGARNIEFALNYLKEEGLRALSTDVGGVSPRKVNYFPSTGRAMVKRMKPDDTASIRERDRQHLKRIEHDKPVTSNIELF